MCANQIPGRFGERTTGHDCTMCWRNGGIGHTLTPTKLNEHGNRIADPRFLPPSQQ